MRNLRQCRCAGSPAGRHLPALALVALLLTACEGQEPLVLHGGTMGTTYSVKVVDPPRSIAATSLQQQIDGLLDGINDQMSTYREDSELSRFNRSASTSWMAASPELVALIATAREISILSAGAFDVTVGPLVNVWGFGPTGTRTEAPPADEIGAARARVGYARLEVRAVPPAIRKVAPDLYVDLSAIAKGYAVDRVADALRAAGMHDYMVEVGGEIYAAGRSPRETPWKVGIEKPAPGERTVHTVVNLRDVGVATSGDYRNYFEQDGKRYSHTIDPATGFPVRHRLASVTVLHPSTARADALATALLVMGPEDGPRLAEEESLAALFIIKVPDGFRARTTTAFSRYTSD